MQIEHLKAELDRVRQERDRYRAALEKVHSDADVLITSEAAVATDSLDGYIYWSGLQRIKCDLVGVLGLAGGPP